jgi:hypothetical protein
VNAVLRNEVSGCRYKDSEDDRAERSHEHLLKGIRQFCQKSHQRARTQYGQTSITFGVPYSIGVIGFAKKSRSAFSLAAIESSAATRMM